ncbi:TetR/AcrR family transcriptional regulator [Streptomyces sp. NPDC001902]
MVRSDARRNRDRILAAARAAFAEDGAASMNQIAQRAGVGPGTLYRNYASRDELILDIYREEVEELAESVSESLSAMTPIEALRHWTTKLVDAMRKKHALGAALTPDVRKAVTEQTYGPVFDAITLLFDAGKADGSVRTDAEPGDFLQLTGALWRASEDRTQPMLTLILDGLMAPTLREEPAERL